jgi:hypothetical protein
MKSGDMTQVESAVKDLYDFAFESGVEQSAVTLYTEEDAKSLGKKFDEFKKGFQDPEGRKTAALFEEFDSLGEFKLQSFNDAYKQSGGTKGGENAIPPVGSIAVRMDVTDRTALMSDYNTYEQNIEALAGPEKDSQSVFKNEIRMRAAQEVSASLRLGRDGENVGVFDGYKQALEVKAAKIFVDGNASNIGDAVAKAKEHLSKTFNIVESGNTSVMLTKNTVIPQNDAGKVLGAARDMKNFSQAGIRVDYKTMLEGFSDPEKGNPRLKAIMESSGISLSKDGKLILPTKRGTQLSDEQILSTFQEAMEEFIVVTNDPHNENAIKYYIHDKQGGKPTPIPQIVENVETDYTFNPDTGEANAVITEGTSSLIVDMDKYYGTWRAENPERDTVGTIGKNLGKVKLQPRTKKLLKDIDKFFEPVPVTPAAKGQMPSVRQTMQQIKKRRKK